MPRAVVFVPGKRPKPPPPIHRDYLWRCARQGVARSDPGALAAFEASRFVVAAWTFLYYQQHQPLAPDVPWIERLLDAPEATPQDKREARRWSRWLTRLLYSLGDRAHWALPWLPEPGIQGMIQDTRRYFDNTGAIAARVRGVVKAELLKALDVSGSVCLVGHSMGSVIAYEALWELTHEDGREVPVDLFVTLGSPLAMSYVQRRLLGVGDGSGRYPAGIRKWVNVSAVGDLVSVNERLADSFAPMLSQGLVDSIEDHHGDVYTAFRNDSGLNPHRSYGYLVHPRVGETFARWCRDGPH